MRERERELRTSAKLWLIKTIDVGSQNRECRTGKSRCPDGSQIGTSTSRYLPRENKKPELSVFTRSGHLVYVSIYRIVIRMTLHFTKFASATTRRIERPPVEIHCSLHHSPQLGAMKPHDYSMHEVYRFILHEQRATLERWMERGCLVWH